MSCCAIERNEGSLEWVSQIVQVVEQVTVRLINLLISCVEEYLHNLWASVWVIGLYLLLEIVIKRSQHHWVIKDSKNYFFIITINKKRRQKSIIVNFINALSSQ